MELQEHLKTIAAFTPTKKTIKTLLDKPISFIKYDKLYKELKIIYGNFKL